MGGHEGGDPRHREARRARRRRRKERILHTRISEELEGDLRRAAEDLRVPVSNLVRNVLEEAVSVVEAVGEAVEDLDGQLGRKFGDLIDDVVDGAEQVAERFQARRGRGRGGRWTEAARAASARSAPRPAEPAPAAADGEARPRTSDGGRPTGSGGADPEPRGVAVLGWQPLVLDGEQRCECGRVLAPGSDAYVALTLQGLVSRYRCAECIGRLGGASGV